jgi:hypothetical protein
MNALSVPRLLLWSSIATLNGVPRKINCSLNTAIVSVMTIIEIVIVTMVMTTTTVIAVLRDGLNWTPDKNTPHYGAKG